MSPELHPMARPFFLTDDNSPNHLARTVTGAHLDYKAARTANLLASVIGAPSPSALAWANEYLLSFAGGTWPPPRLEGHANASPSVRTLSAVEELVMLTGWLDALRGKKGGRNLDPVKAMPEPENVPEFSALKNLLAERMPGGDPDVDAAATILLQRTQFIWLWGILFLARDLVVHGKATAIGFGKPDGPWQTSLFRNGLEGILPAAPVIVVKIREEFNGDSHSKNLARQVRDALESQGVQSTSDDIHRQLLLCVANAHHLMEAIVGMRAAIMWTMFQNGPGSDKARKWLMALSGQTDGRPAEIKFN